MDIPSRALERRKLVKILKFLTTIGHTSSGECFPPWSCLHVDLHWVHYNGWHSGVLAMALPLLVIWQRHNVHVIDNSPSSDYHNPGQFSIFRQLYLHLHQLLGVVAMCLDSRFMHVLVQFLVFRMFPRDDPSSERRGNKCPYGWVGGFIPHPFNTDPSTSKSSTGKRLHSLCCGLHNVCTGKPSRPHNCWLERTEVFLHFDFSFFFFTFHSGLPCSVQASCTFNISPSCFIQSKENQNQKQK